MDGMRHMQIYSPAQYADQRVTLIGIGTIGSHLALTLARMQVAIDMYDDDTIEEHNIATQAYGESHLEQKKVDAVAQQVLDINSGATFTANAEIFEPGKELADGTALIVSAVDSLDARKEIASDLIEREITLPVIDGRVGREQVEVYYFPTAKEWLAQLPEEADEDPCGARFTAYTANIAAGLMANNVKKVLLGERGITPRIIYDAYTDTFIKDNVN